MTTTLKRIDEDSYAVMVGLHRLGIVSKGWSRTGGQGWIYTNGLSGNALISTTLTLPTRRFAVQRLVRRIADGTTDSVNHLRRIASQRKTTK